MAATLLEHDSDNQRHPSLASLWPSAKYERNGRRRVRRKDNLRFAGNDYIVQPSLKDYEPTIPLPRTTFPTPVPLFISRANPSITSVPLRDPITANAGRYSLSLKGIRKRLRKAGPKTEQTVSDIDDALTTWLNTKAVVIQPDTPFVAPLDATRMYIDTCQSIQEISRSVLQLIWRVDDDFSRFLLHCVARFYGVVSYSKTITDAGRDVRVTYLLRPNATRPDYTAPSSLETPPATDADALSIPVDTDNSEYEALSDVSDVNEDYQEGKLVTHMLPTVLEGAVDDETHTEDSDFGYIPVLEDEWSEDCREKEDYKTSKPNMKDSSTLEPRRSRIKIASQKWTRSISSSRSPRRPFGRPSRLQHPVIDKQLKFSHYVYG